MPRKGSDEEAVFLDALECQSPDELSVFLDERCAGDSDLRDRVVALLHHHESRDRILDAPELNVFNGRAVQRPGEGVGSIVGQYKLLEQIGEGGMGVVYMGSRMHPYKEKLLLRSSSWEWTPRASWPASNRSDKHWR